MRGSNVAILTLLILLVFLRFLVVNFFPLMRDEAYYAIWTLHLDWGYFDHPPFVAWTGILYKFFHSAFALRFGGLLLSIATLGLLWSMAKKLFPEVSNARKVAVILAGFSLIAILQGCLFTPDSTLFFAWVLALHEALAAMAGGKKRWISCGVAVGLGLLAKYSMVLILPVLFFGLLFGKRKHLLSIYPYAGLLTAFLIFFPHLIWNAQNDWVTMRFQLKRGLENEHAISLALATDLPLAQKANPGSFEYDVGNYFTDPRLEREVTPEMSSFQKFAKRMSDFFLSQILLWGALLAVFGATAIGKYRARNYKFAKLPREKFSIEGAQSLLWLAAVIPFMFFGAVACVTKVEANWPALYVVGASFLIARSAFRYPKTSYAAAAINLFIVFLVFLYSVVGGDGFNNRVQSEVAGYKAVSKYLEDKNINVIFFDTYQLGAVLSYLNPSLWVVQWPGITRYSEFLRRKELNSIGLQNIRNRGSFLLLTQNQTPPIIPEFKIGSAKELRSCAGNEVQEIPYDNKQAYPWEALCKKKVMKRWFLIQYDLKQ